MKLLVKMENVSFILWEKHVMDFLANTILEESTFSPNVGTSAYQEKFKMFSLFTLSRECQGCF